ncbi:hypothetical protein [Paenibacillus xerothermodurans]|uniref:Uncharacterized protein n=1 Tax=Paenibacillus xerothermodurans TaxID=1977292 RepID=A0A2W1NP45_PAEXE|nr:hypothetical protein [Paenibacillus xerothermodurans]PZE20683.1 hypothetical protein CBW46_010925 [Paenibacillus xerothermodurans]
MHASLPGSNFGVIYVTVTQLNEEESAGIPKIYPSEPVTAPVSAHHIRMNNITEGVGGDAVTVLQLREGDTVRLYSDAKMSAAVQTMAGVDAVTTVQPGQSVATLDNLRLDDEGGILYISVTAQGKRESSKTIKKYEAQ